MAEYTNRKLLILYILKILENHSDKNHPLVSQQIIELLDREHNMQCERKAIARNISCLLEAGYDISTYTENCKGYFLRERTFEDAELRLLIDGILASRHIPANQGKELIDKLKQLTNKYSRKKLGKSNIKNWKHTNNVALFYIIECLNDAIAAGKKVRFTYNEWGDDKKLHPRSNHSYTVNPYEIVSVYGVDTI